MPLWAIVALLVAGAVAGLLEPGGFSRVFGSATLYVFLPALLFEAAWNLDARVMRAQWRPIVMLAVPGVLVTSAVVTGVLTLSGFPLAAALIVGACVSATDPIAIVAIFRRLPLPQALSTIVQSESLLNDAMAVLLYNAVLAAVFTFAGIALAGLWAIVSAVSGVGIGIALGLLFGRLLFRSNRGAVQVVATLLGAYASYYAASALHASGLFAAIAFGVALREVERRVLSVQSAAGVARFWDAAALVANACVFFLTGAAVALGRLFHEPLLAAAAIVGILLARLILAYVLTPLALGKGADAMWLHVVRLAGARGALSLALALAVPATVAMRPQIVDVTFAVVIATMLASTLLVPRTIAALTNAPEPRLDR